MVIAETADLHGQIGWFDQLQSMTTVRIPISPRGWRWSATRRRVLIDPGVDVFPKTSGRDAWRSAESGKGSLSGHEHSLSEGNQLTDGHAIACDDECLPFRPGPA